MNNNWFRSLVYGNSCFHLNLKARCEQLMLEINKPLTLATSADFYLMLCLSGILNTYLINFDHFYLRQPGTVIYSEKVQS